MVLMREDTQQRETLFTDLVTKNQARIYAYIYALVQNAADTEDIVQQTLLVLWRRFDDFEQGSDFCAWAMTAARFEVLNFRRAGRQPSPFTDELLNRIVDRAQAMTGAELDEPRRDALRVCLDELAPADRELLDLRYSQDQMVKAIAAKLNRPERSLSNSLTRVRRWLFDCVRRRLAQEAHE